jgi:O-antigen ligase
MYRSFHTQASITHADNEYLQIASETGLIGIGVLFILFLYLFYKACRGIISIPFGHSQRHVAIGGLVGPFALMFHSLVERNLQIPANALLFALLWAVVLKPSNS